MGSFKKIKKAVVLFNLGGPSSPEEIKPFLLSLFSDPAILTLPQPFRSLLAFLITKRRLKEAQHIYAHLGGRSPLLENTQAQAEALETELGDGYKVFVAMRHANPVIEKVFQGVLAYEPDETILLPLFPQYSTTITESAWNEWKRVSAGIPLQTHFIHSYPSQNGFIEAIKELALPSYEKAKEWGIPRVLLTAHGLPERIIKKGDPYQQHVERSARTLLQTLPIPAREVRLCYQSQVGPLKWLGPSTRSEIIRASEEKRPLVVVPLSFVSEHSETLVELDITYQKLAFEKGCPAYYRVQTVQTHPLFIKGLSDLVRKKSTHSKVQKEASHVL